LIYADASALVKLVLPEVESSAMVELASSNALVMRRAVRRHHADRLWVVELALAEIAVIDVSTEVLRLASVLDPVSLRTLDAIHLASALDIREEIDAFAAYDTRLLEAARAVGFPTISPE
jgi:predicted nucleic acid-binding protein